MSAALAETIRIKSADPDFPLYKKITPRKLKSQCLEPDLWVIVDDGKQGYCYTYTPIKNSVSMPALLASSSSSRSYIPAHNLPEEESRKKQKGNSLKTISEDEDEDEELPIIMGMIAKEKKAAEAAATMSPSEKAKYDREYKPIMDYTKYADQYRIEHTLRTNRKNSTGTSSSIDKFCQYTTHNFDKIETILAGRVDHIWTVPEGRIGVGSVYGKIYRACDNVEGKTPNCEYVVKVILVNRYNPDRTESLIINEIKMQEMAAKLKLAPHVVDAFYCAEGILDRESGNPIKESIKTAKGVISSWSVIKKTAFIVMKTLSITVREFICLFRLDRDIQERYHRDCLDKCSTLLRALNSGHIAHNDPHAGNFMFTYTESAKRFMEKYLTSDKYGPVISRNGLTFLKTASINFGIFSMQIIDFGKAARVTYIPDENPELEINFRLSDGFDCNNLYLR